MRKFRVMFIRRMEYGLEYYQGDIRKMIDLVHQIWMNYGNKKIIIDKSIEYIKPNGIQAFVNSWLSKQEDPINIDLSIAYTEYVKLMKDEFLTNDYADQTIFIIYLRHILNN